jgi:hypothetical protein
MDFLAGAEAGFVARAVSLFSAARRKDHPNENGSFTQQKRCIGEKRERATQVL